jgi:lysozyme-like protein
VSGVAGVNGIALAAAAAGAVLLWSGVKGTSVTGSLRSLISGKAPPAVQTTAIADAASSSATSSSSSSSGTGTYNHASLMTLWQAAGGSASTANNAACHAMQESSGRPAVTSANPDGGQNVGLWQLDTRGVGAGYTVAELSDPMTNARITVEATSDGANWSEWSSTGC